jgi:MFS family permease
MGALRDARFRRLLTGASVSSFGDTALYLSLGIWAKDLTGSNAAAGGVFLALTVPVLFGPLAGALVDRVRRRPLLIATNAVTGMVVLSLLAVRSPAELWLLYAVAFGYGCGANIMWAAQAGLLKDLLPDDQLASANGAMQTLTQGLRLVSPLAGAGLYSALGGGALAVFDAATFAVAVAALASIRVEESRPSRAPAGTFLAGFRHIRAVAALASIRVEESGPSRAPAGTFLAGFRHIRAVAVLAQVTAASAVAFGVLGLYETVAFAIIDQGLHRPPSFFGVLTSVQGIGAVSGGLIASRLGRRLGEARLVGLALAAFAVGSATFTAPSTPVVLAAAVINGAAMPWFLVGFGTAMQRYTPPGLQGRVTAASNLLVLTPQTVSIALGAVLIGLVDYRFLLVTTAVVTATAALPLLHHPAPAAPMCGGPELRERPAVRAPVRRWPLRSSR